MSGICTIPEDVVQLLFEQGGRPEWKNMIMTSKQFLTVWQNRHLCLLAKTSNIDDLRKVIKQYRRVNPERIHTFLDTCPLGFVIKTFDVLVYYGLEDCIERQLERFVDESNQGTSCFIQTILAEDKTDVLTDLANSIIRRADKTLRMIELFRQHIPTIIHFRSHGLPCQYLFYEMVFLNAIDMRNINVVNEVICAFAIPKDALGFGLARACLKGDVRMVKLLHDFGVDLNYQNGWCLYLSIIAGSLDVLKYLIENGVPSQQISLSGIHCTDNLKLVKYIFRRSHVDSTEVCNAICDCLLAGRLVLVEYLSKRLRVDYEHIIEIDISLMFRLFNAEMWSSIGWLLRQGYITDERVQTLSKEYCRVVRKSKTTKKRLFKTVEKLIASCGS